MKALLCFATIFFFSYNIALQADPIAKGNRFEVSGYLSMISYGENISLQTDISGGINFLNFLNFSIGVNLGYRNYSLTSLDYISVSAGKVIRNNEFRLGGNAGLYTLRLSGYRATIPCIGGEIIYSYNIVPNFSIRIKERICNFIEDHNNLISTSTYIGFCFSFYSCRITTKE